MDYEVTIAIPVYNVEKYVENSLNSALNQTFNNIEFLIIYYSDDDPSMQIVKNIIANHTRKKDIRIINQGTQKGLGEARNVAIANARGNYLYYLDSDDEITPNCIEVLHSKIKKYQVDFVAGSHARVTLDKKNIITRKYNNQVFNDSTKKVIDYIYDQYYTPEYSIYTTCWNKLYDINFLRNNNISCLHKGFGEDILFTFQVILHANSCVLLSDILYYYYIIPESATEINKTITMYETEAKNALEIMEYKKKYLNKYSHKPYYSNIIKSLVFESYYYASEVLKSPLKNKKRLFKILMTFPIEYKWVIKKRSIKIYIMYIISISPYFLQKKFIDFFRLK